MSETPEERLERIQAEHAANEREAEAQFMRGDIKSLEAQVEDLKAERTRFINLVCTESGSFPASAPTDEDTIKRAIADGKAKAILGAMSHVQELEERVAFAELARDNAIAQRDAVIERAARKARTAGLIISQLKTLVRVICEKPIEVAAVEVRLDEILKGDDDEKTPSTKT